MDENIRGVAAGIVVDAPQPGPEHKALEVIIGKWINQGHTIATPETDSVEIHASDIYEWMPGGFFVLHTAYGRIGTTDVGGTEIIGYDPARKRYRSTLFDSQGNVSTDDLVIEGDTWTWTGKNTGCGAIFTDGGRTQTAHHIRREDEDTWVPSMETILTKVA
jgi:hypothetical protein